MKRRLCLLLSVFVARGAFAAGVPLSSEITAVTVYTDRAIVTRTAAADLPAGIAEYVFENLPATLVDQSIQVSGRGATDATILDVTVNRLFVDQTPNERIKALDDQLRVLQGEARLLDDRGTTVAEQRDFVKRMISASTSAPAVGTSGAGSARPGLDDWQRLFTYTEETFGKLAAEVRAIDSQREAIGLKKAALEAQKGILRGSGQRASKAVTVRLSTAVAGRLDLSLAYSVPGASWTPAYDARMRAGTRAVELTYFGIVRQNTGEDWKGVVMTLSTAQPALGGAAPTPRTWVVNVAPPRADGAVAMNAFVINSSADSGSFRNFSVGSGGLGGIASTQTKMARVADTTIESSVTSATFKVAAPVTLASTNESQKLGVTTARLDCTLQYTATPKLIEAAYLVATAVNTTDFPLLAGTMNTFLNDTFVASNSFKSAMPGEKFELPFGADESIGVKRKLVNRFSEDTGLANRGHRVTYDVTLVFTNNKKTTERIAFKEPLPVSGDEKIVVKLQSPAERDLSTPDRPRDITRDPDGVLLWKLELKPGEKREITIKASIDHPADLLVAGME